MPPATGDDDPPFDPNDSEEEMEEIEEELEEMEEEDEEEVEEELEDEEEMEEEEEEVEDVEEEVEDVEEVVEEEEEVGDEESDAGFDGAKEEGDLEEDNEGTGRDARFSAHGHLSKLPSESSNIAAAIDVDCEASTSVRDNGYLSLPENHVDDENAKPIYSDGKDLVETVSGKRERSCDSVSVLNTENKISHIAKVETCTINDKSRVTRSRSPAADVIDATNTKKPAIICDFFAKGWCIKGTSCRFLHQKDGAQSADLLKKTDDALSTLKSLDNQGMKQGMGESASPVLLSSGTTVNSLPTVDVLLSRALVHAYGDEGIGEPLDKTNVNNQHQHFVERRSIRGVTLPGLMERKMHQEMPSSCYLSNGPSYDSLVMRNSSRPGYKFPLDTSSTDPKVPSSSYRENNRGGQSLFKEKYDPESSSSHRSRSPLDSTFGNRSTSNTKVGNKHNGLLEYDTGHFSRYRSLMRSYASTLNSSWEPSVPFRSSICPISRRTSPGNRYDPLLDSIETSKANSQSPFRKHTDKLVSGVSDSPPYSTNKLSDSMLQYRENGSTFQHGIHASVSIATEPGSVTTHRKNGTMHIEDKNWSPYDVEVDNIRQKHLEKKLKVKEEGDEQNKESKIQKAFRTAIIEFVKDILKPSWRDGHLSKDAFKVIVKRTVEKVVGSLNPHQVPINAESIEQYLSSSRPKLVKLIEGYVGKYNKS